MRCLVISIKMSLLRQTRSSSRQDPCIISTIHSYRSLSANWMISEKPWGLEQIDPVVRWQHDRIQLLFLCCNVVWFIVKNQLMKCCWLCLWNIFKIWKWFWFHLFKELHDECDKLRRDVFKMATETDDNDNSLGTVRWCHWTLDRMRPHLISQFRIKCLFILSTPQWHRKLMYH